MSSASSAAEVNSSDATDESEASEPHSIMSSEQSDSPKEATTILMRFSTVERYACLPACLSVSLSVYTVSFSAQNLLILKSPTPRSKQGKITKFAEI